MSLIVYPYRRNEITNSIESIDIDVGQPNNDFFGFESWRHKVWGSNTLIELGCSLLPKLKKQDIYAENEELLMLKKEIGLVLENIKTIEKIFMDDSQAIEFRLRNALLATRIAIENPNCGVYIG